MSHLHRNVISHPLPEVVGKVHLRLREHFVYDCLWDPALQMTETGKENIGLIGLLSHLSADFFLRIWWPHAFRSMFSNQVNLVLSGSSAQGLMTIQVGPFSALKQVMCQFKWNCSLICIHLFLQINACFT